MYIVIFHTWKFEVPYPFCLQAVNWGGDYLSVDHTSLQGQCVLWIYICGDSLRISQVYDFEKWKWDDIIWRREIFSFHKIQMEPDFATIIAQQLLTQQSSDTEQSVRFRIIDQMSDFQTIWTLKNVNSRSFLVVCGLGVIESHFKLLKVTCIYEYRTTIDKTLQNVNIDIYCRWSLHVLRQNMWFLTTVTES